MKRIDPFPEPLTMQLVERPFITKTGAQGTQHVFAWVLTPQQEDWMRRWFPEVENAVIMDATGMSFSTLHRFARQLHLTKSAAGMRGIKKRQAAHIKKVCEANGYYDSMRGHQPSQACQQAAAKMWQDIRDGRRLHPAHIMKQRNPRRYRKWQQRKSEARKQVIHQELTRLKYGLERKTKLPNIVLNTYTHSQRNHRYSAQRRGYILADDCREHSPYRYNIYYDADTKRSEKFEKNLIADGFHLLPWPGDE